MIHTSSNDHLADISKKGDLISRADAIDLLRKRLIETANNNVGFTCDAGQVFEDASERIRYWIDELSSAQPETAKRIVGKSRDGMTFWYQCDMCNEPVDAQDNYCRGCGRRLIDG